MSVDGLARSIQKAVGKELRVRVDREAFDRAPDFNRQGMAVEPGDAKLSNLLFEDLQNNHLDFHFDLQGITIIPSVDWWSHTELVDYSADDYGMSVDELRDAVRRGATTNESWSDVGGPAVMVIDEERGVVSVLHTQSNHARMDMRLRNLTTPGKP
jgi:hypothetical protein